MRVVLVNRSDLRGGAAVVTYRLMHALCRAGVDARMLVIEKLSNDPRVHIAASHTRARIPFLKERLRIFAANGFNRADLFKADSADSGLPLWKHPLVKEADAVLLNWVNQGMLSLQGVERIAAQGKKIIWTMHDMWCATGICHHAGKCRGYTEGCGNCPLLNNRAGRHDLSAAILKRKQKLYDKTDICFVAVSNWLARCCKNSTLLKEQSVCVIPNAFPDDMIRETDLKQKKENREIKILMGAARIDDPVKGFDIALEALRIFARNNPEQAAKTSLTTFGDIRDASLLQQIALKHTHTGVIDNSDRLRELYAGADIVLSASRYETLPGTLIEGQAQGCLPAAFNRGGQSDIIEQGKTGFLVDFGATDTEAAANMAATLQSAIEFIQRQDRTALTETLRRSVIEKFSEKAVAEKYIKLINEQ